MISSKLTSLWSLKSEVNYKDIIFVYCLQWPSVGYRNDSYLWYNFNVFFTLVTSFCVSRGGEQFTPYTIWVPTFGGFETQLAMFMIFILYILPWMVLAVLTVILIGVLFWKRHLRSQMTGNTNSIVEYRITLTVFIMLLATLLLVLPDVIQTFLNGFYRYITSEASVMNPRVLFVLMLMTIISSSKNYIFYNLTMKEFRTANAKMWTNAMLWIKCCKKGETIPSWIS